MARTRSSTRPGPDGTAATCSRPSIRRRMPRSVTTLVHPLAGCGDVAGRRRQPLGAAQGHHHAGRSPADHVVGTTGSDQEAPVGQPGGVEVPVLVDLGRTQAADGGRPRAAHHHAEDGRGVGEEGGPREDPVVEDVGVGRRRGVVPQPELGGEAHRSPGGPGPGHGHPGGQIGHTGAGQHGVGPVLGHDGLDLTGTQAGRHLPIADGLVHLHRVGVGVVAPRVGVREEAQADEAVVAEELEVGRSGQPDRAHAPAPMRRSRRGPRRRHPPRTGCPRRSRPPGGPGRSNRRGGPRRVLRRRPALGGRGCGPGGPAPRGRGRSTRPWPPRPAGPPTPPRSPRAAVRTWPDCRGRRTGRRGTGPRRGPGGPGARPVRSPTRRGRRPGCRRGRSPPPNR